MSSNTLPSLDSIFTLSFDQLPAVVDAAAAVASSAVSSLPADASNSRVRYWTDRCRQYQRHMDTINKLVLVATTKQPFVIGDAPTEVTLTPPDEREQRERVATIVGMASLCQSSSRLANIPVLTKTDEVQGRAAGFLQQLVENTRFLAEKLDKWDPNTTGLHDEPAVIGAIEIAATVCEKLYSQIKQLTTLEELTQQIDRIVVGLGGTPVFRNNMPDTPGCCPEGGPGSNRH